MQLLPRLVDGESVPLDCRRSPSYGRIRIKCVLQGRIAEGGTTKVLRHQLRICRSDSLVAAECRFLFSSVEIFSTLGDGGEGGRRRPVASGGPGLVGPWFSTRDHGEGSCGAEDCREAVRAYSNVRKFIRRRNTFYLRQKAPDRSWSVHSCWGFLCCCCGNITSLANRKHNFSFIFLIFFKSTCIVDCRLFAHVPLMRGKGVPLFKLKS